MGVLFSGKVLKWHQLKVQICVLIEGLRIVKLVIIKCQDES